MSEFVLVPGGWGGGWRFDNGAARLRNRGHTVHQLTLTGVGERAHLGHSGVNLDTHIDDVCAVFEVRKITGAVLCGHSYGGMVIAGVAERIPERITRLVYIDAYVPENGDSCFSMTTSAFRELFLVGARSDGLTVAAPEGTDPRATAHPLGSFLQAITLTGRQNTVRDRDYVYLSGWPATPFTDLYDRLKHDPSWRVHDLPTGHNVMAEDPDALTNILAHP